MKTPGHTPRRSFYILAEQGTGWWISDAYGRRITKIAGDAERYDNYAEACRGAITWMISTGRPCGVFISTALTETNAP